MLDNNNAANSVHRPYGSGRWHDERSTSVRLIGAGTVGREETHRDRRPVGVATPIQHPHRVDPVQLLGTAKHHRCRHPGRPQRLGEVL